jgi:Flp pilus assembly pilin Flp
LKHTATPFAAGHPHGGFGVVRGNTPSINREHQRFHNKWKTQVKVIRKQFARFGRSTKGVTAVEIGVAAPLVILIFIAVVESALILYLNTALEGNLRDAARVGAAGTAQEQQIREELIIEKIAVATLGLIAINQNTLTTLVYDDFASISQAEPFTDNQPENGEYDAGEAFSDINGNGRWDEDMGVPGLGNACDIVMYRVETKWPLMLGLFASVIGDQISISATTAVRNEGAGDKPC